MLYSNYITNILGYKWLMEFIIFNFYKNNFFFRKGNDEMFCTRYFWLSSFTSLSFRFSDCFCVFAKSCYLGLIYENRNTYLNTGVTSLCLRLARPLRSAVSLWPQSYRLTWPYHANWSQCTRKIYTKSCKG